MVAVYIVQAIEIFGLLLDGLCLYYGVVSLDFACNVGAVILIVCTWVLISKINQYDDRMRCDRAMIREEMRDERQDLAMCYARLLVERGVNKSYFALNMTAFLELWRTGVGFSQQFIDTLPPPIVRDLVDRAIGAHELGDTFAYERGEGATWQAILWRRLRILQDQGVYSQVHAAVKP